MSKPQQLKKESAVTAFTTVPICTVAPAVQRMLKCHRIVCGIDRNPHRLSCFDHISGCYKLRCWQGKEPLPGEERYFCLYSDEHPDLCCMRHRIQNDRRAHCKCQARDPRHNSWSQSQAVWFIATLVNGWSAWTHLNRVKERTTHIPRYFYFRTTL
jgi:hypothetical protein